MIPFIFLSILVISFIYSIQKRNKFKSAVYNISSHTEDNYTEYYLVVEMRHGQFLDARRLPKFFQLFIPTKIASLLNSTYTDFESAQKSLQEVKQNS